MRTFLIATILMVPTLAEADTLILQDGQRFTGVVIERGDQVEVRLDIGTVGFMRSEVKSIERSSTKLHELERRMASLSSRDLNGTMQLARWAAKEGLTNGARSLFRAALRINPNLDEAHRALGHEKVEGRWMTREERLAAEGQVRYGGRWMSKADADRMHDETRARRAAREAKKAATKAEREADRAEEARIAAERAAREADQQGVYPPNQNWNWAFVGFGWLPGQGQVGGRGGYGGGGRARGGVSPVRGLAPLNQVPAAAGPGPVFGLPPLNVVPPR